MILRGPTKLPSSALVIRVQEFCMQVAFIALGPYGYGDSPWESPLHQRPRPLYYNNNHGEYTVDVIQIFALHAL